LYEQHKNLLVHAHRTGFYHVLWFEKAVHNHVVDFKPIQIMPKSFLFIHPDMVQSFSKTEAYEGKVILFTADFFCHTEQALQFLHHTILFNDLLTVSQFETQSSQFECLFTLLAAELQTSNDVFHADILRNLLHSFLLLAERERRLHNFVEFTKSPELDCVVRFKALLNKYFKQYRLVSSYATKLQVTEKRLNAATTKILGKSPKEIINDRVLLEAKRLLIHTTESIKKIGYDLGFDETTNFIKYFRKHTQHTPLEFREQFLAEQKYH